VDRALRVLLLEDEARDAELVRDVLEAGGIVCDITRVQTREEFVASLDRGGFDLILADHTLPSFDGMSALKIAAQRSADLPFIFVSGTLGEEVAIEAIKLGATDYVLKERLSRIVSAVRAALREKQLRAERERAEQALQRSEKRFRAMVEKSAEGVLLIRPDMVIIYASQSVERLLGDTPDELIGQSLIDRVHPDYRQRLLDTMVQVLQGPGRVATAETMLKHTDGSWRWIERTTSNLLDDPNVRGLVYNFRDITERKRAEEALRRGQAYLTEAERLSHTGSFAYDPASGRLLFWSEELSRICGLDPQRGIPDPDGARRLVHPDDLERVSKSAQQAFREKAHFTQEYRLLLHDGTIKHIRAIWHPVLHKDGEVLEYIGTVADVTERKRAEVEREQLEQRLRQAAKMEAVGRLAGGVAHDFNNVLAGIFAYGEMLFEETPDGSPLRRYAQNVLAAATRGRELVDQILGYSRSHRGRRTPVDIATVVAEALELVRGSLPAAVCLEASTDRLPLVVIGDATRLHEVVMNLCRNAMQAMSGGGTLRVVLETAEVSAERALSHGTLAPGRYVRLAVEDTGSGMDEATLCRIFEPFFTTKEIGQGTGLGLSLVYMIVADMGGAIDVKSVPKQGTTVTIYLTHSEAALASAEETTASPPRGNGERLMLVDDEAPLVAAIAEVLSRLGYEPLSFGDSRAALAAFEAAPGRFDVVITDEVMPGLTGTGLATAVRRVRPDLPVLLLSGNSSPPLPEQALAAGVNEVLTKPLQSREIAAALARVLHRAA